MYSKPLKLLNLPSLELRRLHFDLHRVRKKGATLFLRVTW